MSTARNSKKASNSMKNQNVYFCIDEPYHPVKGVRGRGIVKIYEDTKYNLPITEKILTKYLVSFVDPLTITILDTVRNSDSIVLEITLSYFSTWKKTT